MEKGRYGKRTRWTREDKKKERNGERKRKEK